MPRIEIVNRWTRRVIYTAEAQDLRAAVEAAARDGADLRSADLRGANLGSADLRGANLGSADLGGADLRGANLGSADLRSADLGGADLGGADLRGANLGGADLGSADLGSADLRGANLHGATIPWNSHDAIADLLRRAAGQSLRKRMVAGLVLVSRDLCWDTFFRLRKDPLYDWALDTLAAHVRDGDGAPRELAERARALRAAGAEEVPDA